MKNFCLLLFAILSLAACKKNKTENQPGAEYPAKEELDEALYQSQAAYADLDSLIANFGQPVDYAKPAGYSFAVDKVPKAKDLLPTFPARAVMQQKVGKLLLFIPPEQQHYKIVSAVDNGLLSVVQECYASHRPLILTPDAVWLAICQGVSLHINQNFKKLESVIFVENKPNALRFQEDALLSEAIAWNRFVDNIAQQANMYTKDEMYSLLVPTFSTTTRVEQTAFTVTMLEAFEQAFVYIGDMGCGIPTITIAGTKEDWELIYSSLDRFRKLGLDTWVDNLKPVIHEFIAAVDGKPTVPFWQNIYKDASDYGAFYVSGWIIKFYPYIVIDGETVGETDGVRKVGRTYAPNEFMEGDRYLLSTLSTDNFPSGMAQIEVIVNNHYTKETTYLEVYAGFMGMKQYADKSLEPFISWAVCAKSAPSVDYGSRLQYDSSPQSTINNQYWHPDLVNSSMLLEKAMYAPNLCETYSESENLLLETLRDSLSRYVAQKQLSVKQLELDFIVTSSASVIDVKLLEPSDNKALSSYCSQLLLNLPQPWQAASAKLKDVFFNDIEEGLRDKPIKVNSKVHLTINL